MAEEAVSASEPPAFLTAGSISTTSLKVLVLVLRGRSIALDSGSP